MARWVLVALSMALVPIQSEAEVSTLDRKLLSLNIERKLLSGQSMDQMLTGIAEDLVKSGLAEENVGGDGEPVEVDTYSYKVATMGHKFPEAQLQLQLGDVAVAFSGGGNRALSASMGQLRAFEELKMIQKVGYMSSVSGGSWASAIYQYYQKGANNDGELLGVYTDPSNLTMAVLDASPPPLARGGTQSWIVTLLGSIPKLIGKSIGLRDLWTYAVGEIYLEPFGLNCDSTFYTYNETFEADVKKRNPALANATFFLPRADRPFWVANAGLLGPSTAASSPHVLSAQFTPFYAGSPFGVDRGKITYQSVVNRSVDYERFSGGGFLDNYAFGANAPPTKQKQKMGGKLKLHMSGPRFTIKKAIAMSSMAPGYLLGGNAIGSMVITDQNYWPNLPLNATNKQPAAKNNFVDGGSIDNTGIISMLQRGVKKVIAFNNAEEVLPEMSTYNACNATRLPTAAEFDSTSILPLFGKSIPSSTGFYGNNHVFAEKDFLPLMCQLQTLDHDGHSAVAILNVTTVQNTWWNIEAGRTVQLMLFYLNKPTKFVELLPTDTQQSINKGSSGEFANFPNYKTMFQNAPAIVQYKKRQINLLGQLTDW
eukprot:CAMPEP_0203748438 /NCGR_PEP_ID=MMETSP0098-20131031/3324_1 /ASSEMBLY_ACC=CAM_ASM_000208 /TAXON_ID=96639 /ORGANISM=" , Strain NY0313808BC1" /LENGTH=595 /DNA_ID=CAMNT_0050637185 /DNA_START=243 /DNA_END=2027 /DNA_ORIENTATION=-